MICHKPDLNQDWWGSWYLPFLDLFFFFFLINLAEFSDFFCSPSHSWLPQKFAFSPPELTTSSVWSKGWKAAEPAEMFHCPSGNTQKYPRSWYDSELVVEKGQTRLQQHRGLHPKPASKETPANIWWKCDFLQISSAEANPSPPPKPRPIALVGWAVSYMY